MKAGPVTHLGPDAVLDGPVTVPPRTQLAQHAARFADVFAGPSAPVAAELEGAPRVIHRPRARPAFVPSSWVDLRASTAPRARSPREAKKLYRRLKDRQQLTYRGANRPPAQAFAKGFVAKGGTVDLQGYVADARDSEYVSTSRSLDVARSFRGPGSFIYVIRPRTGIDVGTLDDVLESSEQEVAVPGAVPPSDILGAFPIQSNGKLGRLIDNPAFEVEPTPREHPSNPAGRIRWDLDVDLGPRLEHVGGTTYRAHDGRAFDITPVDAQADALADRHLASALLQAATLPAPSQHYVEERGRAFLVARPPPPTAIDPALGHLMDAWLGNAGATDAAIAGQAPIDPARAFTHGVAARPEDTDHLVAWFAQTFTDVRIEAIVRRAATASRMSPERQTARIRELIQRRDALTSRGPSRPAHTS
ncbi:MAG: hypothetical protein RIT81_11055 [Deltaproteobacteria bacterium]